jgi:hypothetical protein
MCPTSKGKESYMKVEYGEVTVSGMPEVKGVFVGGCVERGIGSSFRRTAHAHNSKKDEHFGWICVRSAKRVLTDSGKPTALMMHEYAHILCPNHGHDALWRETITRLGYPSEAKRSQEMYSKKPRTSGASYREKELAS